VTVLHFVTQRATEKTLRATENRIELLKLSRIKD